MGAGITVAGRDAWSTGMPLCFIRMYGLCRGAARRGRTWRSAARWLPGNDDTVRGYSFYPPRFMNYICDDLAALGVVIIEDTGMSFYEEHPITGKEIRNQ